MFEDGDAGEVVADLHELAEREVLVFFEFGLGVHEDGLEGAQLGAGERLDVAVAVLYQKLLQLAVGLPHDGVADVLVPAFVAE